MVSAWIKVQKAILIMNEREREIYGTQLYIGFVDTEKAYAKANKEIYSLR